MKEFHHIVLPTDAPQPAETFGPVFVSIRATVSRAFSGGAAVVLEPAAPR